MYKTTVPFRGSGRHVVAVCLLTAGLLLASACASIQKEPEGIPTAGLTADSAAELQETARTSPDAAARARASLQLAIWHASHTNPSRDYSRALKEFKTYVSLTPEKEVPPAVQDWIAVLQDLSRATQEADQAAEDLKKARQRTNQLSKETKELKDALDRLKALDLKMEEKRRQAK